MIEFHAKMTAWVQLLLPHALCVSDVQHYAVSSSLGYLSAARKRKPPRPTPDKARLLWRSLFVVVTGACHIANKYNRKKRGPNDVDEIMSQKYSSKLLSGAIYGFFDVRSKAESIVYCLLWKNNYTLHHCQNYSCKLNLIRRHKLRQKH